MMKILWNMTMMRIWNYMRSVNWNLFQKENERESDNLKNFLDSPIARRGFSVSSKLNVQFHVTAD